MFSNSLKKNELYIKIVEKLVIRKTSRRKINSISKRLNLSHDYINWIESGTQNFPNMFLFMLYKFICKVTKGRYFNRIRKLENLVMKI